MWFWPWQKWDSHRVVAETNIDLSDKLLGIRSTSGAGMAVGLAVIAAYYAVALLVPYLICRIKNPEFLRKLGLIRYLLIGSLFWTMFALPIKILSPRWPASVWM